MYADRQTRAIRQHMIQCMTIGRPVRADAGTGQHAFLACLPNSFVESEGHAEIVAGNHQPFRRRFPDQAINVPAFERRFIPRIPRPDLSAAILSPFNSRPISFRT